MTPMNLLLLWTKLDMANDEIESVCYVNALFPFVRAVYRWHTTEIPKKIERENNAFVGLLNKTIYDHLNTHFQ